MILSSHASRGSSALRSVGALLLAGASSLAQNPNLCQRVHPEDIATLVTLQPSRVVADSRLGPQRCDFTVLASSGRTIGSVELNSTLESSYDDALHMMWEETTGNPLAKNQWDEGAPLIHTTDATDRVTRRADRLPGIAAVHGTTEVTASVTGAEDAAAQSPGYRLRLERLALQAAGSTILPTPGMPPDPVPAKPPAPATGKHGPVPTEVKFFVVVFDVLLLAVAIGLGLFLRRFIRPGEPLFRK